MTLHSSLKRILLCFFQVEKILDVILSSPGTRIGQASECFVYWKDDRRNDTWGLNFTSPIDAKQFRECCDFSKSSARYLYKNGLRLGSKSSPASPTKQEPQCTCLVSDKQQTKLRSMQNRGKSSDLTSFLTFFAKFHKKARAPNRSHSAVYLFNRAVGRSENPGVPVVIRWA